MGLQFVLSPIFHSHKIKDGGYNNSNTNKVSPAQNTPTLQATRRRVRSPVKTGQSDKWSDNRFYLQLC